MGRLYQCVRKDKGNGRSCVTAVSHALGGPVGLTRGRVGRVGRGGLFVHHGGWAGDERHRLFGGVALVVRFWRVGLVVLGGMSDGSEGRGEFPHVRMRDLV